MRKKQVRKEMKQIKIGTVIIPGNLILAPMAGVTDLPFRLLCLSLIHI